MHALLLQLVLVCYDCFVITILAYNTYENVTYNV